MSHEERQPLFDPTDPDKVWGYQRQPLQEPTAPPLRLGLHLALLLATIVTTIIAGALNAGVNLLNNPLGIYQGIPFSFTLLLILGTHEMGHYLVSRRHHLHVTLPYFIPAPPVPFIVGTFGAFIRILSPIKDKRALLDVGCAGPLTGVVVAIPVILVGLNLSTVQVIPEGGLGISFGEPLLFQILSYAVFGSLPADQFINLHPVGFAGWIGLLVTALNLIPVGQTDGGHVVYALFPSYHKLISWACLLLLAVSGLFLWVGWLVWALLLLLLGRRHPPPVYDWVPLDRKRKLLGIITILVFLLTITPVPIQLG